jgi:hypothetical protein
LGDLDLHRFRSARSFWITFTISHWLSGEKVTESRRPVVFWMASTSAQFFESSDVGRMFALISENTFANLTKDRRQRLGICQAFMVYESWCG